MRYRALALFVAVGAIASSGVAQQTAFRPSLEKCPAQPAAANIPSLKLLGPLATDKFDLEYATLFSGVMEVKFTPKNGNGTLLFIGVEHVISPNQDLFNYLENSVSSVKPDEIFVEVDDTSYLAKLSSDKTRIIQTRGEPSYMGFIARQANIPVLPLDPQPRNLFENLRKSFSANDIGIAFVLREIELARDRRHLFGEALEREASPALAEQHRISKESGDNFAVVNIFQLTRAVDSRWRGLDWRQVPAEWFNPLLKSDFTDSKFVNTIFTEEMAIRDRHALDLLLAQVILGKRVIALAGRSHAESHLQTLNCSMAGR